MRDWRASADAAPGTAGADLGAFFRHRGDVPAAGGTSLISSLSRLQASDDPIVAFGRLPEACVPDFADGCQVELSDGAEPSFRTMRPASSNGDAGTASASSVPPEQLLVTPFRAVSLAGYPSYAGVVTYWWTSRLPAEQDAVIADLIVRQMAALVEHERLLTAMARAEDRAANLALEAISGHTISLATGIVMHQAGLAADDAEHLLRQSAVLSGTDLHQMAAGVVQSGSLGVSPATRSGAGGRGPLRLASATPSGQRQMISGLPPE
jgi:hypothetical protein